MKGFAVTAIIVIVLFAFVLLFVIGVSGNYNPAGSGIGDVIGAFFSAVAQTFGNFIVLTNLTLWTMIFFTVQGVFLYIYYKMARFIWVRIPEFQQWFEKTKSWAGRY